MLVTENLITVGWFLRLGFYVISAFLRYLSTPTPAA